MQCGRLGEATGVSAAVISEKNFYFLKKLMKKLLTIAKSYGII
nr:MAG TPA: hypothetical protein [Caudoviricetes sp.]